MIINEFDLIGKKTKDGNGIVVGVILGKFIELQNQRKFKEFKKYYPYIKQEYMEEMYEKIISEAIVMSIPINKLELE